MAIGIVLVIFGLLCERATAQSPAPANDLVASLREEDKPWNRDVSPEDQDAAEALFAEGNRLFHIPLFRQAAEQYTAALRTWKHPGFFFNLALAQLNTGEDVAARENLERALQYGADPLGDDARFAEGRKQLAELERKLGRVQIDCATPGAVVTLDGVTVLTGKGRYQGWTLAKTHELSARSPNHLAESRQIIVRAGAVEQIDLKLVTLDQATDQRRRWAVWKPWAVLGAGAAIAAGGGVFHWMSVRNADRYEEEFHRLGCASDQMKPGCQGGEFPSAISDNLDRAQQQKTIALGSYVVGGAVVGAGLVLWYLNRPRLVETRMPTSSSRRVAIVPAMSTELVGVLVTVTP